MVIVKANRCSSSRLRIEPRGLRTPAHQLNGQTPVDALNRDQSESVRVLVTQTARRWRTH